MTDQRLDVFSSVAAALAEKTPSDLVKSKRDEYDAALSNLTAYMRTPEVLPLVSREENNKLGEDSGRLGGDYIDLLAELVVKKRSALYDRAMKFGASKDHYRVTVRAYVNARGGETTQVHIPGYDNIASRDLEPIDRTGLILNAAEAKQLRLEYNGAKKAKATMDDILNGQNDLIAKLKDLMSGLGSKAAAVQAKVGEILAQLTPKLSADFLARLTSPKEFEDVRKALSELSLKRPGLKEVLPELEKLSAKLEYSDALDLVFALQERAKAATDVISKLKDIPDYLSQITKMRPLVEKALEQSPTEVNRVALEGLRKIKDAVLDSLPALQSLLNDLNPALDQFKDSKLLTDTASLVKAASRLQPSEPGTIPRTLDNLEDAMIDLRRSGILVGDSIVVDVDFQSADLRGAPARRIEYSSEAVLTGIHRDFSADVVFSKKMNPNGGEDKFQTNVGIAVEWHCFERNSPGSVWNWFDLAVGIHATNLDMDSAQVVELGAGVNASVWQGLVRVGVGYNLSVGPGEMYYYFGFGLFGLLNQIVSSQNLAAKP